MIVVTFGTTYLTVDAFLDRFEEMPAGRTFSYATGDLANACVYDLEARALRELIHKFVERNRLVLTQAPRPDLVMKGGGRAFEYFATKRTSKLEA